MKVESIAIVGTGVIGSSWAAFYAAKGFQVKMWDVDADLCQRGHQQAADIIRLLQAQGILSGDNVEESISRTGTAAGLSKPLKTSSWFKNPSLRIMRSKSRFSKHLMRTPQLM